MKSLIIGLLLVSGNALAWGPTGHRVVGQIAERFMTPEALVAAHRLLEGQSLARVSTWADEIRSEPRKFSYTFNWHFTDWPDGDHQHDEQNSAGLLVTAIRKQMLVLRDPKATPDKKAFALKFIVHLVGDLHMPLHVGNGLDRGGNDCKVLFHRREMNLHELWDDHMIDFTRLSFTELADFIHQGRTKEEIRAWREGELVDWAQESRQIRSTLYPRDTVTNPNQNFSGLHYCRKDITIPTSEMPALGFEYSYRFMPVVEQRLFQAGLRLAVLLNSVL
jgi:hypothetical protein